VSGDSNCAHRTAVTSSTKLRQQRAVRGARLRQRPRSGNHRARLALGAEPSWRRGRHPAVGVRRAVTTRRQEVRDTCGARGSDVHVPEHRHVILFARIRALLATPPRSLRGRMPSWAAVARTVVNASLRIVCVFMSSPVSSVLENLSASSNFRCVTFGRSGHSSTQYLISGISESFPLPGAQRIFTGL